MKKIEEFSLVDGTFSADEAREVLFALFKDKISFHQRKNFSSNERFGKDDLNSLKRIEQLKKNCDRIFEVLKTVEGENGEFKITSSVNVSFLETA